MIVWDERVTVFMSKGFSFFPGFCNIRCLFIGLIFELGWLFLLLDICCWILMAFDGFWFCTVNNRFRFSLVLRVFSKIQTFAPKKTFQVACWFICIFHSLVHTQICYLWLYEYIYIYIYIYICVCVRVCVCVCVYTCMYANKCMGTQLISTLKNIVNFCSKNRLETVSFFYPYFCIFWPIGALEPGFKFRNTSQTMIFDLPQKFEGSKLKII